MTTASAAGFMQIAIEEAMLSLREGNHGFGAVIIRGNEVLARAHDREESDCDPTSHAEVNAIRIASKITGGNLEGCILLSTHEPCPMCSAAVIWSGIGHIVFGYPISEAVKQGRKRIGLTCEELFTRAEKRIRIEKNVLFDRCSVLYRQDVRKEITKLRNAGEEELFAFNAKSAENRLVWFSENRKSFSFLTADHVDSAYRLLLLRFGIGEAEAPVVHRTRERIVFHSKNFCPTLEACKILGLDTRYVCKRYNERSTDSLIKLVNRRLKFERNYTKLRPYSDYCEESISLQS